ncbi:MAG: secondary thiamine-phosphate synthase enzyme YjbQ [Thermoproteota archaeon]|nr:secondary thiamine-phosphate synthase enzyme YjbQ [Thermoproteota archaeon]
MTVLTKRIQIKSKGESDIIDITDKTSQAIKDSKIKNGLVTVFVSGSTAAVTTIEYEPGLRYDFPEMLSRVAPKDIEYEHDNAWHDGNGHSHVRASLIGPSLTIPIVEGNMSLGTWQQIVFLEMDTRPRDRNLILQLIGE